MSDDLAPREAWVDWADIETQDCAEIRDHGSFGGQRCLIVPLKDGEPGRWEVTRTVNSRGRGRMILQPLPKTRTVVVHVHDGEAGDLTDIKVPADMTDAELLERIREAVSDE